MNHKEENIDLAKEAPLLAALSKEYPFLVPNHYFETLKEQINHQILIDSIDPKTDAFETPRGYFEDLTSNLLARIAVEEKLETTLSDQNGFTIPENYFSNSKTKIEIAFGLKNQQKAKIIHSSFIRFAAAACILISCTIGIYLNIDKNNNINYQLSKVSNDEIEAYLNQNTDISEVSFIVDNLDHQAVFTLDNPELTKEEINLYLKSTY